MIDGDEIKGVLCGRCGGSVEWRDGRPYCDWDGAVAVVSESVFLVSRTDDFDDTGAVTDDDNYGPTYRAPRVARSLHTARRTHRVAGRGSRGLTEVAR